MKRITIATFLVVSVIVLALSIPAMTHAQTSSGYELTCSAVAGGGTLSTGNGYTLSGTIGQPDAGQLSGGGYTLTGGFGACTVAGTTVQYRIYLPLLIR